MVHVGARSRAIESGVAGRTGGEIARKRAPTFRTEGPLFTPEKLPAVRRPTAPAAF